MVISNILDEEKRLKEKYMFMRRGPRDTGFNCHMRFDDVMLLQDASRHYGYKTISSFISQILGHLLDGNFSEEAFNDYGAYFGDGYEKVFQAIRKKATYPILKTTNQNPKA